MKKINEKLWAVYNTDQWSRQAAALRGLTWKPDTMFWRIDIGDLHILSITIKQIVKGVLKKYKAK